VSVTIGSTRAGSQLQGRDRDRRQPRDRRDHRPPARRRRRRRRGDRPPSRRATTRSPAACASAARAGSWTSPRGCHPPAGSARPGAPSPAGTVYGMCKAAHERFTTGLAAEVYAHGIAVNVLPPSGLVPTPGVVHHNLDKMIPEEHHARPRTSPRRPTRRAPATRPPSPAGSPTPRRCSTSSASTSRP